MAGRSGQISRAGLDLGLLVLGQPLLGRLHDGRIDQLAAEREVAPGLQLCIEAREQRLGRAGLGQGFSEAPNRRIVGNRIAEPKL